MLEAKVKVNYVVQNSMKHRAVAVTGAPNCCQLYACDKIKSFED